MKVGKNSWILLACPHVSSRSPFRISALFLLLLFGLVREVPAFPQNTPPGNQADSIRGTVINSVTREPIGRALVTSPDNRFATMSDGEGHFEFTFAPVEKNNTEAGLPSPGSERPNQLTARKPGFLNDKNGMQDFQSIPVSKEVTIALTPEALILGHVQLPTAEAPDRIQLEIYRHQVQDGRARWSLAGSISTRSTGEFRFADLAAGSYKLLTRELTDRDPLIFTPGGQLYGYPPVYFPNATDFATADIIQLQAGQTFQGNISLVRRPYYPVKIAVGNAPSNGGISVTVSVQGRKGPGFALGYVGDDQMIEGNLPDGNYTVEGASFAANGATGLVNISVKGAPLEGPRMTLIPNASIELKVTEEFTNKEEAEPGMVINEGRGRAGQGPGRYLNLSLEPADDFGQRRGAWLRPPATPEDESLFVGDVQPGRYWVRVQSSPRYAASITSGTTDLLHHPLAVGMGGSAAPIEITMRNDGAEIDGRVDGVAGPTGGTEAGTFSTNAFSRPNAMVSGVMVYFVPQPDSPGEFREIWVSPDGTFNSPDMPPGVYRVLAFDRQQTEMEYRNPEAMKGFDSKGQIVRLAAGQKEHLHLKMISSSEQP